MTSESPRDRAAIEDFIQKYRLPFPLLYADGLDATYGVKGWPTTVAIDRHGSVSY